MLVKREELVTRFFKYVQVPSQSKPNGGLVVPSTESQWAMIRLLQEECETLGLVDLHVSDKAVLTGRLPAHVQMTLVAECLLSAFVPM